MTSSDLVSVTFETSYDVKSNNLVMGLCGSTPLLGTWDPSKALLMSKSGSGFYWKGTTMIPLNEYFEWKMLVFDKVWRNVYKWEDRPNRWTWVERGPIQITVCWEGSEVCDCLFIECKTLRCYCLTPYSTDDVPREDLITVVFISHYHYTDDNQVLAVLGSGRYLGNWMPQFARQFDKQISHHLQRQCVTITMPRNERVKWKLVLLNRRHREVIRWEDHGDRSLDTIFPAVGATRRRVTVGANWDHDAYKVTKFYKCVEKDCLCHAIWPREFRHVVNFSDKGDNQTESVTNDTQGESTAVEADVNETKEAAPDTAAPDTAVPRRTNRPHKRIQDKHSSVASPRCLSHSRRDEYRKGPSHSDTKHVFSCEQRSASVLFVDRLARAVCFDLPSEGLTTKVTEDEMAMKQSKIDADISAKCFAESFVIPSDTTLEHDTIESESATHESEHKPEAETPILILETGPEEQSEGETVASDKQLDDEIEAETIKSVVSDTDLADLLEGDNINTTDDEMTSDEDKFTKENDELSTDIDALLTSTHRLRTRALFEELLSVTDTCVQIIDEEVVTPETGVVEQLQVESDEDLTRSQEEKPVKPRGDWHDRMKQDQACASGSLSVATDKPAKCVARACLSARSLSNSTDATKVCKQKRTVRFNF